MRNYEKKLELACHWMEQLDVLQPCINALRKGELWQSEGAGIMSGLLYTAEPAIREQAKKLEEKYDALVWHAIKGTYIFGGTDRMEMVVYLMVTEDDIRDNNISLEHADTSCYYCFGFVENRTEPMFSESGDCLVSPANGGLRRVA